MARICLTSHKGDEVIATYEPGSQESVQVAQQKLTAFLEVCVSKYGKEPPVWARRANSSEFDLFDGDLSQVDEVLLQYPLVGG